jgi:hypothetical protein
MFPYYDITVIYSTKEQSRGNLPFLRLPYGIIRVMRIDRKLKREYYI